MATDAEDPAKTRPNFYQFFPNASPQLSPPKAIRDKANMFRYTLERPQTPLQGHVRVSLVTTPGFKGVGKGDERIWVHEMWHGVKEGLLGVFGELMDQVQARLA